jgi:type IV fimbrial biogenesis protein FimT
MVSAMRARGFTMIELLIVLSIVAILASFALPNLADFILRVRLKTAASDLHTTLLFARSEAIKRNATVTIQPLGGTDWSQGWEVRAPGIVQPLLRQDGYSQLVFTPTNAAYGAKTVTSVTFSGSGREGSTDGVAFILTALASGSIQARCVVLDPSGRPAVRHDRDTNAANGCN